jgi:type VI secretion system protein ImpA
MLDLEALLQPIEGATPSGSDLRYAPEYADLERAMAGKAERALGDSVVPGEPPDWRATLDKGAALLGKTKDLRVAVAITRALLELHGFAGLAEGVTLIDRMVQTFWDTLHPQLDAEDGNDPTARVNAMAELTRREVIQALRAAPLVVSRVFGVVNLKAIEQAARGASAPSDGGAASSPMASIEGAFQEVPLPVLAETAAVVTRCVDATRALAEKWAERLPTSGPDFTELRRVLGQAQHAAKGPLDQRQSQEASSGDGNGTENLPDATEGAAAARQGAPGRVQSREDVLRAIDAICAYYAKNEPSSPVPLLLQRSKRLVMMSFMDILKDMLPDSVQAVEKITGKDSQ